MRRTVLGGLFIALVISLAGPASAQEPDGTGTTGVDIGLQVGPAGEAGSGPVTPIRVRLSSPRAARLDVAVTSGSVTTTHRVDLSGDGPVHLDVVGRLPTGDVEVQATTVPGGKVVGHTRAVVQPSANVAVGVGESISPSLEPTRVNTVAQLAEATLIPLSDDAWRRPAYVESLDQIVLGPADLDRLEPAQVTRLRHWVHNGGDLAIDMGRTDPLPVIDIEAAPGQRTPIGAGWVRFTDGAAAAHRWGDVVEPAVAFGSQWFDPGRVNQMVGAWMPPAAEMLASMPLVDVRFISSTWVIAAVAGTALLAGPGLWLLLRGNRRRRWMWGAAPGVSIVVAVALIGAGQGVFRDARPLAQAVVRSSPWGSVGDVAVGFGGDPGELRLDGGALLLGSSDERLVLVSDGVGRTARLRGSRNGFGFVGVTNTQVEGDLRVDVTAVANADGTAEVSVTNRTRSDLLNVTVEGVGRQRPFADVVRAGSTVSRGFAVNPEVPALSHAFDSSICATVGCWGGAGAIGDTAIQRPAARGVVSVTGTLTTRSGVGPLRGDGFASVVAVAPIELPPDADAATIAAAVRVESLRPPSIPQAGIPIQTVEPPVTMPPVEPGMPSAPTTVVVGEGGPAGAVPAALRITSPADRPGGTCAIHTIADDVEIWDGSAWKPLVAIGAPRLSPRLTEPNEVQDYAMPAMAAGVPLYLRYVSHVTGTEPAMLVDCGELR
jgi:hypothetical protein